MRAKIRNECGWGEVMYNGQRVVLYLWKKEGFLYARESGHDYLGL